jgi:hypothetical protein
MTDNFIHPETKKPDTAEDANNQRELHKEQQAFIESKSSQVNADYDARMAAARKILELQPDLELQPNIESPDELSDRADHQINPEASLPTTEEIKANLNAVFGGDPQETERILDASQMDVPALASLIKKNTPPHAFEGASPDKLVEALGNAADEKPDYPMAA